MAWKHKKHDALFKRLRLVPCSSSPPQAGIAAEFQSGALMCAGAVTIQREGNGGVLLLEGSLSDEYYKIREIVYGQYNIC